VRAVKCLAGPVCTIGSVVICCLLLIGTPASAQTTWQGADGGDWSTAGNWDFGVPTSFVDAVLNNGNRAVVTTLGQECQTLYLGDLTGSGNLTIQAGNLTAAGIYAGQSGAGWLDITGGQLFSTSGSVGAESAATGVINVTGSSSAWTNTGPLSVGEYGTGTLGIASGAQVSNTSDGQIGVYEGSTGSVTVTGSGSQWTNSARLYVGYDGSATLLISNGGLVRVDGTTTSVGLNANSTGNVTVQGANAKWTNSGALYVGQSGDGTLSISGGGNVTNTSGQVAYASGSTGNVTVSGANSTWTNSGELNVGSSGSGTLIVSNGGQVSSTQGYVGRYGSGAGNVTITGTGSAWSATGNLYLGGATIVAGGAANVSVTDGGQINVTGLLKLLRANTTLIVDGGSVNAGILEGTAGTIRISDPTAGTALTLGSNSLALTGRTFSGTITDNTTAGSLVKDGSNTQILAGANTYSGGTTVKNGTLLATNTSGSATGYGAVTVQNGGTLGGDGTVGWLGKTVSVEQGGRLTPGYNDFGILSVADDLSLASGSLLSFDLNDPLLSSDMIAVGGDLSLANGVLLDVDITSYTPEVGDQWTLFTHDDLFGSPTYITVNNVTSIPGSSLSFSFSDESGNLVMTLTAVPEPSTLAMLAGSGAFLAWGFVVRRRKLRQQADTCDEPPLFS